MGTATGGCRNTECSAQRRPCTLVRDLLRAPGRGLAPPRMQVGQPLECRAQVRPRALRAVGGGFSAGPDLCQAGRGSWPGDKLAKWVEDCPLPPATTWRMPSGRGGFEEKCSQRWPAAGVQRSTFFCSHGTVLPGAFRRLALQKTEPTQHTG